MRQLHVTGFLGTPSFLMSIVEAAEGMHLDLKRIFILSRFCRCRDVSGIASTKVRRETRIILSDRPMAL